MSRSISLRSRGVPIIISADISTTNMPFTNNGIGIEKDDLYHYQYDP